MTTPLVSVIMCVHNEEPYVRDAIDSILGQTYDRLELIIIDDYSTDKSLAVCHSVNDPRIRIYSKTSDPKNLAASRNMAVRIARGEYITLQDADDICHPTRIQAQMEKALQSPEQGVVGCSIVRVEYDRRRTVTYPENHESICRGFRRLLNRTTICAGTLLASKKIFEFFPYRTRFQHMQDWDHILRMYESGRVEFSNCQEPLYTYYIRSKSVIFKPEWLDYNIFVRHCQTRRRKGLEEFSDLTGFRAYLDAHPLARIKWLGLRKLIELNRRIKRGQ